MNPKQSGPNGCDLEYFEKAHQLRMKNCPEYELYRLEQCRRNAELDAQLARIFRRMEIERSGRTEEARKVAEEEVRLSKTNSRAIEGVIVSSDKAIATKPVQTREFDSLATHLERLTQQMIETLDLTKREGLLDRFRGVGGRIEVRIERSGQLGTLLAAFGRNIEEVRSVAEKFGELKRVPVRQQLQRMEDEYALLQAQIRIDNAHEEARQRWRLEDARVNAEIDKLKAGGQKALRDALPPLPPPPAPAPVDEATRRREAARRQKQHDLDLEMQNLDLQADADEGKVARAKEKAIEIFNNQKFGSGETRARIQAVLDAYGFESSILSEKMRDYLNTYDITEETNYDMQ